MPAQGLVLRQEEFVELRRLHRRARQHGMDLPAVMDLVDEEMIQHRFDFLVDV